MRKITLENAKQLHMKGELIIVDVREKAEYIEGHLAEAINLPLSEFSINHYLSLRDQKICLLCQSQSRAKSVYLRLKKSGFSNQLLMEKGYNNLYEITKPSESPGWTIDRQFRMVLGLLLAVFLLGYNLLNSNFIVIPIILATGLVFTSIIDRCYMRMGIALLPWNKGKKQKIS